jgi:hypothetical protein
MGTGNAFTKAVVRFAQRYADQNERDHEELVRAIERRDVPSADESHMASRSAGASG